MSDERWLSIQEACAEVGVSRRTIYNWLQAGKLDTQKTIGGSTRIRAGSLWRRPTAEPSSSASASASLRQ
jgi:excisionase family DNA binding protein